MGGIKELFMDSLIFSLRYIRGSGATPYLKRGHE